MPVTTDPQINTRLRPEVMEWVDEMAERLEMTRAEFVRSLLERLSTLPEDDPARMYNAAQGVLMDRIAAEGAQS
jgi:hypothetical protein